MTKREKRDRKRTVQNDYITLFLVYTAPHDCVGPLVTYNTVTRIGNGPILGASWDINVPDAVPVTNPCGNIDFCFIYVLYSSWLLKVGNSSGVSFSLIIALVVDDDDSGDVSTYNCVVVALVRLVVDVVVPTTTNADVNVVVVVVQSLLSYWMIAIKLITTDSKKGLRTNRCRCNIVVCFLYDQDDLTNESKIGGGKTKDN